MDLSLYTTGSNQTSNGGNGSGGFNGGFSGAGGGDGVYGSMGKREREEGVMDGSKGVTKKRPKVVIKMDED